MHGLVIFINIHLRISHLKIGKYIDGCNIGFHLTYLVTCGQYQNYILNTNRKYFNI